MFGFDAGLQTACWPMALIFSALAMISFTQFSRLSRRSIGWTTQRTLHGLILVLCVARVIFFLVALQEWDPDTGRVRSSSTLWHPTNRIIFYVADELPAFIFFTVHSAVVLFWAELYVIAADQTPLYHRVLRPLSSVLNFVAFLTLIFLWVLYGTRWRSTDYYVNKTYAIFLSSLYLFAALGFAWIGRSAAMELKQGVTWPWRAHCSHY